MILGESGSTNNCHIARGHLVGTDTCPMPPHAFLRSATPIIATPSYHLIPPALSSSLAFPTISFPCALSSLAFLFFSLKLMATSIISSYSQFPASLPRRHASPLLPAKGKTVRFAHRKDSYGPDFEGHLVDENMIVLRKRIHELRMAETNYEPPSNWMEWEKRYCASYHSDVCEVLGLLQTLLMNARPGLAIGMAALFVLSVPTSAILILYHVMEASRSILS